MFHFISVISGLLMAGSVLHAQDARSLDENFLSSIRREAERSHPSVQSAFLRSSAAAREVRGVRLWDDPMVGLSIMAADKAMRMDDGDIRVSLEQPIPKPGLYAANLSKAKAMQRAEQESSRLTTLEAGAAAASDAIELALVDESIVLQVEQLSWLKSMADNASEMSLNPDATSVDALRLESELARENEVLAASRRTRESLAKSLNLRLGRPLESPWPTLRLSVTAMPVPVAAAEIARISRVNPKVRSKKEMANAANADTRIADRDKVPQFAIGVESAIYSGGDLRSVGVGVRMSLPAFNRAAYDSKIDASKLRELAAVRDVDAARLEVATEVLAAVTAIANAAAQANAYAGGIYNRAMAASQSVEASWISSKSPLTDLLEANRILFSIRLEQRRFVAMQYAALEQLHLLVPSR